VTELIVPRRFNGPPTSGNGGWTAGALAAALALDPCTDCAAGCPHDRGEAWPAVEVSLRQPPPLDTTMHVECHAEGEGVAASFGGAVIATARRVEDTLTEVSGVDAETAHVAMASYAGLSQHPFPTCFACGPGRPEDDGLGIFGGRVDDLDGRARLASVWTPDASLSEDYHQYVDDVRRASLASTWAALDCIGGWAGDLTERMMVLARMTARIDALPVIGEEHVVVGAARGEEGRKVFTASTLHDVDGRVVGTAEHVWVQVDPSAFG
jgi:hypothetical protein